MLYVWSVERYYRLPLSLLIQVSAVVFLGIRVMSVEHSGLCCCAPCVCRTLLPPPPPPPQHTHTHTFFCVDSGLRCCAACYTHGVCRQFLPIPPPRPHPFLLIQVCVVVPSVMHVAYVCRSWTSRRPSTGFGTQLCGQP